MEDNEIIELFFSRDETAIRAVSEKFGGLCLSVSRNILHNTWEAEECVNDAFLKAWESIPPVRPKNLSAYLARIAKNVSINRYNEQHAEKRGGGAVDEVFEELEEFIVSDAMIEQQAERREILAAVNTFLGRLSRKRRMLFVRRYWYCDSAKELSRRFKMSEAGVFTALSRTRTELKSYLKRRGFLDE